MFFNNYSAETTDGINYLISIDEIRFSLIFDKNDLLFTLEQKVIDGFLQQNKNQELDIFVPGEVAELMWKKRLEILEPPIKNNRVVVI